MIVVDTMTLAYGVLPHPDFEQEVDRLRQQEDRWVAPPLWRSELRNTVMQYIRSDDPTIVRSDLTLADAFQVMDHAEQWMQTREVLSRDVLSIADASNCTPYDAEYMALAERLDVALVTYDRAILRAMPDRAVRPREFGRGEV